MRKLLVALAAAAVLATMMVASAGPAPLMAKPTTTTATPPTTTVPPAPVEVLGIPHVVHQFGLAPDQQENHVRCPAGEVAVSITFSMPGPMFSSTVYSHPTLLDEQGRPNGYRVWVVASGISLNASLLCAPVVTT